MKYFSKILCLAICVLTVFLPLSCDNKIKGDKVSSDNKIQIDGVWYRTNLDEANMNLVTISEHDENSFLMSALCMNGANLGEFEERFVYKSKSKAYFSGTSESGINYTVFAEFQGNSMKIYVDSEGEHPEYALLGLGFAVTLSGEYSKNKPEFDYTQIVLEKVFMQDKDVADLVKEYLGEQEFDSFVHNFGMSTYISQTQESGNTVVKGLLRGIGNRCAFCVDDDGYFYGYNDYKYFSNNPEYKENPPEFFSL